MGKQIDLIGQKFEKLKMPQGALCIHGSWTNRMM
jgi:hypothetical protein